jgi:S1-C subfamily serine protease
VKPQLAVLLQIIMPAIGSAIASAQSPVDRESAAAVAAIERTIVDAIARAEPSVVAISRNARSNVAANADDSAANLFQDLRGSGSPDSNSSITGAGVIIERGGLVLTHYLAVREGDEHTVTTIDGKAYPAAILAADPRSALAVLAIQPASARQRTGNLQTQPALPPSFPVIGLGDAQKLRKGQFVITIGNPFAIQSDGQATASWGIVTNLARKAPVNTNLNDAPGPNGDYRTTLHHLGTLIQTDAKLGWSAAGAALINMQGELVGITTTAAIIAGHEQPAGYAIPINATLQRIIDTLKEGREVEYGMLGVSFSNLSNELGRPRPRQVVIGDVLPGMPAAKAGLQSGDVISSVASQPVHDIDSMQLTVSTSPPATSTTIEYLRGGRSASTKVTLSKLAVAGKTISTIRPESWHGIRVDYATALEGPELMQAISSGAYDAEGCVLVSDVEAESVAWRAGIRPGTFISHVGGKRVSTPAEFHVAARESGGEFDVRLTRPNEQSPSESEDRRADSDSPPPDR